MIAARKRAKGFDVAKQPANGRGPKAKADQVEDAQVVTDATPADRPDTTAKAATAMPPPTMAKAEAPAATTPKAAFDARPEPRWWSRRVVSVPVWVWVAASVVALGVLARVGGDWPNGTLPANSAPAAAAAAPDAPPATAAPGVAETQTTVASAGPTAPPHPALDSAIAWPGSPTADGATPPSGPSAGLRAAYGLLLSLALAACFLAGYATFR